MFNTIQILDIGSPNYEIVMKINQLTQELCHVHAMTFLKEENLHRAILPHSFRLGKPTGPPKVLTLL